MTERSSAACLLYADVAGGARLAVKLGEAEAGYAVERCLNRMSRCAEAYSASGLELHPDGLLARFPEADSALLAAREMRERVRALPPMSGIKLVLRAGVVLEAEGRKGRWRRPRVMAVRLVTSHNPDTISVSESFSEALSPSMRRMLSRMEENSGVPFPTLELGDLPPPTPGRVAPRGGTGPQTAAGELSRAELAHRRGPSDPALRA
jgi:class 3 adenylate cyclase